ncbi:hypothetical protein GBA52_028450 [Prunus armeniaca]|nr:hypothetical protein GBA52_028450 [Prunus armeniaca]
MDTASMFRRSHSLRQVLEEEANPATSIIFILISVQQLMMIMIMVNAILILLIILMDHHQLVPEAQGLPLDWPRHNINVNHINTAQNPTIIMPQQPPPTPPPPPPPLETLVTRQRAGRSTQLPTINY